MNSLGNVIFMDFSVHKKIRLAKFVEQLVWEWQKYSKNDA